jgi:hypothetical protein
LVLEALRRGEETLSSGFILKKNKMEFNRLVLLNQYANDLFQGTLDIAEIPKICKEINNLQETLSMENVFV